MPSDKLLHKIIKGVSYFMMLVSVLQIAWYYYNPTLVRLPDIPENTALVIIAIINVKSFEKSMRLRMNADKNLDKALDKALEATTVLENFARLPAPEFFDEMFEEIKFGNEDVQKELKDKIAKYAAKKYHESIQHVNYDISK